ncbi:M42 family metallopeptidase [Candidatus Latescibacterota bacterium]
MKKNALDFLKNLLKSPSPSGYEQPVQKLWRDYVKSFAKVHTDTHGNTFGVINPGKTLRILFTGHCDEIGFMVRYIDDKGFLYFGSIGGFDESIIAGRRVTIHTANSSVPGVIGKTPIHLIKADERKKGSEIKDLWIDIGAKDKKEAASLVSIGDPVTYTYDFLELRKGIAVARGFDDRIGSFIVAEVLKTISASKKLNSSVYSVSTVQEEIGLRGARTSAFGVDPLVGIATDVTFATDQPGVDEKQVGDIKLGGGPVIARGPNINPRVFDLLVKTAKKLKIKYQIEGIPRATGTDANAIQVTRSGVAAGLVSVPLRYMHTPVETLNLNDVDGAIKLMAGFAEEVKPSMKFIP